MGVQAGRHRNRVMGVDDSGVRDSRDSLAGRGDPALAQGVRLWGHESGSVCTRDTI